MSSRLERLATSLGGLFSGRMIGLGVLAFAALLLFGTLPGHLLPALLACGAIARSAFLLAEALRGPVEPPDWDAVYRDHVEVFRRLEPADLEALASECGRSDDTSAEQLAYDVTSHEKATFPVSRPRREVAAEWLGLVAFVLLVPFDFALYAREVVSIRSGHGFLGAAVAAVATALYGWPHRWEAREGVGERRSLWWSLPFLPALLLAYTGVTTHHPYLDPRRPDQTRLRAERVLSLRNNVIAGQHADWVFAYAEELATHGERERAAEIYRRGLRLAPQSRGALERLAALERALAEGGPGPEAEPVDPRERARGLSASEYARLPFGPPGRPLHEVPPCHVDEGLENVEETTVVLVPVGQVPREITNAIGGAIREELALPTCRAEDPFELPEPTRFRGVVFGRQWSVESLAEALLSWLQPVPNAPLKLLVVTPVDIYGEGTNFLFSGTFGWGAVLSYARYGDVGSEPELVRHRVAKQALGALLKSFELPPSGDPNCVTSYSNGLAQFDAKGNRPNTETYLEFRKRVDATNRRWSAFRRRSRAGS